MATGCLSCPGAAASETITIRNGTYDQQLFLRNVGNLTIAGESRAGTIVRTNNWDAFNLGTGGGRALPARPISRVPAASRGRRAIARRCWHLAAGRRTTPTNIATTPICATTPI
jgi:hypothetical protein